MQRPPRDSVVWMFTACASSALVAIFGLSAGLALHKLVLSTLTAACAPAAIVALRHIEDTCATQEGRDDRLG